MDNYARVCPAPGSCPPAVSVAIRPGSVIYLAGTRSLRAREVSGSGLFGRAGRLGREDEEETEEEKEEAKVTEEEEEERSRGRRKTTKSLSVPEIPLLYSAPLLASWTQRGS